MAFFPSLSVVDEACYAQRGCRCATVPPRQFHLSSNEQQPENLVTAPGVSASVSFHFFGELSTRSSNNASLHGQWKNGKSCLHIVWWDFPTIKCLFSSRISQHVDSPLLKIFHMMTRMVTLFHGFHWQHPWLHKGCRKRDRTCGLHQWVNEIAERSTVIDSATFVQQFV